MRTKSPPDLLSRKRRDSKSLDLPAMLAIVLITVHARRKHKPWSITDVKSNKNVTKPSLPATWFSLPNGIRNNHQNESYRKE